LKAGAEPPLRTSRISKMPHHCSGWKVG